MVEETVRTKDVTGRKRVVLVEDDADTLDAMNLLLERIAVTAVPASTCAAAQRAADALGGVDLLIADLGLPDGTGLELASALATRFGGCATIIVSGSPPEYGLPEGVGVWLTKPVDFTRFREAVARLVA
jgi:DNA-binding response OmpR family regulator